eukprot:TRINITY_DN67148_c5_g1_i4.p1 TRINITY_DN67148_c5_g1~~TRINITY_DN67148_c5_g1_i4.p1  ORF type:complete len:146 (+),score=11.48 TRINITY_DN67148_c5_g1_i4:570-1007(+)
MLIADDPIVLRVANGDLVHPLGYVFATVRLKETDQVRAAFPFRLQPPILVLLAIGYIPGVYHVMAGSQSYADLKGWRVADANELPVSRFNLLSVITASFMSLVDMIQMLIAVAAFNMIASESEAQHADHLRRIFDLLCRIFTFQQ